MKINQERKYDVVVAGGGVAGISASLAASRQKKKVALIEKQCVLGGLATSGLISIYLPLCDGLGHQVSYGIAYELFLLAVKYGVQRKYPEEWLKESTVEKRAIKRFEVQYNPIYFSLLTEKLLRENGVDIYFDTQVIKTNLEDNCIKSLTVFSANKEMNIYGKAFVDATGNALLFDLSKDNTREYTKNILAAWYYYSAKDKLTLNMLGTVEQSGYLDSDRHADAPISIDRFASNVDDINRFLELSHKTMLNDMIKKNDNINGFEPALIPYMPQLRMTKCLIGKKVLNDKSNGIYENTSIGIVADWRRRGYVYEIPFEALCSNAIKNVFAAGRCISCDDGMWDIMRVIPACAITGEAAGIASSVIAEEKTLEIKDIQSRLLAQKQKIHLSELDI